MPILLFLACVFGSPAESDSSNGRAPADDADDGASTDESPKGSVVRVVTMDIEIHQDIDVEVDVPEGGAFVRVDSCHEEDAEGTIVCDMWSGGYHAYGDGTLILTPDVWDGSLARVTFLVIE